MAVSATVQSLGKKGDRYYLRFADGPEYEFRTIGEIAEWAKDLDASTELLHKLILRWFIARGGTAATASKLAGKTATLDLTLLANVVRVS